MPRNPDTPRYGATSCGMPGPGDCSPPDEPDAPCYDGCPYCEVCDNLQRTLCAADEYVECDVFVRRREREAADEEELDGLLALAQWYGGYICHHDGHGADDPEISPTPWWRHRMQARVWKREEK